MKKLITTILVSVAISSQSVLADDLMSQCMFGVPRFNRPLVTDQTNEWPVTIHSDTAKSKYPDYTVFTGNVDIQQGDSLLHSDEIQLHQRQQQGQKTLIRTIDAMGNVLYADNNIVLKGQKAWSNLNNKDINVWNGNYQMVGRHGYGTADLIKQRNNNRYTILENGSFTSCLPEDNNWNIVGSKVIEDREEEVVKIWNARFKLHSVPIFYTPYLQLPIGNRRRSGFLIPHVNYGSSKGYEFVLPYYWNIESRADATIIPHYMSKRGIQLENEFRYLTHFGAGLMEFDYLPSDDQYHKNKARRGIGTDESDDRWFFYWQHNGVYNEHWRLNTDYSRVSDPYYFNDLNSKYYSSANGYTTQKFSIGYAAANWDATLFSRDFQVFRDTSKYNIYRAQPQLELNFYQKGIGPFDGRIYAQAVKFTNINKKKYEAIRLHIEPTLDLPLSNNWANLDAQFKFFATYYHQNSLDYYNAIGGGGIENNESRKLKSSVTRTIPQLKINGSLFFDRSMDWNAGYTQTLEPRVQYLYTAYRNQSNIYPYDSTLLQTDYTSLFRDRRTYSGLDRIASANEVAMGVTTRIYDQDMFERINFSIGQIYSLTPSRTGVNQTKRENKGIGSLMWAGDTYWKFNNSWGMHGELQYDSRFENISHGNAVLEYRRDPDRILQLNYRYGNPEYMSTLLNDSLLTNNPIYEKGISQVGGTASWPIVDNWSMVGAYYYDTRNSKLTSQLIGLQYSSCCYALRIGYERKINGWENNDSKYDNQISFNIELRGLTTGYGSGIDQMLNNSIIPYQRAF
ncbi:LPS assembly protein LptD [Pantoea sp. Nvir]|uniref:LPS assembly protein LptD n=1 Tax=Pantoea sp. Nvir TaxID=2576760 RepID=UPI00135AF768|nr:LPS assembly protein LptD [Pantoea sp. Nvir]MXP66836.1 LPS assembly protein LptD [Pantoea sp. Nvir]